MRHTEQVPPFSARYGDGAAQTVHRPRGREHRTQPEPRQVVQVAVPCTTQSGHATKSARHGRQQSSHTMTPPGPNLPFRAGPAYNAYAAQEGGGGAAGAPEGPKRREGGGVLRPLAPWQRAPEKPGRRCKRACPEGRLKGRERGGSRAKRPISPAVVRSLTERERGNERETKRDAAKRFVSPARGRRGGAVTRLRGRAWGARRRRGEGAMRVAVALVPTPAARRGAPVRSGRGWCRGRRGAWRTGRRGG
jgi:hypothetical protein